jgi:hypothetical protein
MILRELLQEEALSKPGTRHSRLMVRLNLRMSETKTELYGFRRVRLSLFASYSIR